MLNYNMNMKKWAVVAASMVFSVGVQAQSIDEGIKMYNYERYQTARTMLEPQAAGNATANYYVGLSQIGLDDLAGAKATFSKFPEDPANMAGLARVAFEEKNATEGNKIAESVAGMAKKKNWEPLLYAADAITYTEGGNVMQAIAWYKKALETSPDNVGLHLGLGDAYRKQQGGGGEAMNNYEKITGKDPNNSLAHSRIGRLWYAATTYKLALESFDKAKEADPKNPIPYRELANAWQRSGNYEKAKENIAKYRELSDKNPAVEQQYLDLLYLSKDYPKAISGARELISAGSKRPGVHGILGASLFEAGDSTTTAEAAAEYGTYIQMQDKSKITPKDYVLYGRILMASGNTDGANENFSKGLDADTAQDKSATYREIAEAFRKKNIYTTSAEWYGKLIEKYPNTQALDYFWRGAMLYYAKNYPEADKEFEAMATKYPDQPSAIYWRGRTNAAMDEEGKTGVASPYYNQWLEKVGPTYEKKNDLMQAYQYLALVAFNKSNKADLKKYLDLIEGIEPTNAFLKQLRDLEKTMK
jgi:tetratricopeptide (TPR) repeat protein